jgi:hypothetical protein
MRLKTKHLISSYLSEDFFDFARAGRTYRNHTCKIYSLFLMWPRPISTKVVWVKRCHHNTHLVYPQPFLLIPTLCLSSQPTFTRKNSGHCPRTYTSLLLTPHFLLSVQVSSPAVIVRTDCSNVEKLHFTHTLSTSLCDTRNKRQYFPTQH